MHGLILSELQRFAGAAFGTGAWPALREEAGIADEHAYSPRQTYPDSEMVALTLAVARRAGLDEQALLERFGEFITPTLIERYHPYIKPEWRTLDVIEHTEEHIHRAVRVRDPGAAPPALEARRVNPLEVVVLYRSARRMCGFARGISRGVAMHFAETIGIEDLTCMLKGQSHCTIVITQATA